MVFVIRSTRDGRIAEIIDGHAPKGFPADILQSARRKLALLNRARTLEDMRRPPGNRLEALRGDRAGQHSIRINDQWRLCFRWTAAGPEDVEIVDYH